MPDPLKNMFDTAFLDQLCAAVQTAYPDFDRAAFLARVTDDRWEARELKARMRHISTALRAALPADYRAALAVLRQIAPALGGFQAMILPDFVEVCGLDDWDASIPALALFTTRCSSEYAVRPFILRDPPRMMAQMLAWARDPNEHVRRLASEGCRPRLPWGMALPVFQSDPAPVLVVLEALRSDPSEYVRRSVANNLNDISKDNPAAVLEVLRRWQAEVRTPEMDALIRHALRTLVKKGDPAALALLGFGGQAAYTVRDLLLDRERIPFNGTLSFSFVVESHSERPQPLLIDYVIELARANGRQTAKVFKLSKRTLAPGETITITRQHRFAPVTTRRYYPGEHALAVQINGVQYERRTFVVEEPNDG